MTYEEISAKYPIGKLLARTKCIKNKIGYWASLADKEYYTNNYTDVHFYNDGYVHYTEIGFKEYRVQGWLCTSEGFFVAQDSWDGWTILSEDDLAEIEAEGIVSEF
jgi:hypothetical protein